MNPAIADPLRAALMRTTMDSRSTNGSSSRKHHPFCRQKDKTA
jgi:hypothetical protein